jgi:hypothetical protein
MAVAGRGIDVKQSGVPLLFDFNFVDATTGQPISVGSASIRLFEYQSDATFKSYDFVSHVFVTGTPASPTLSLNHQAAGGVNTGVWTGVETVLSGFTVGGLYLIIATAPSGARDPYQDRKFQYGGSEGDLDVVALLAAIAAIPAQNIGLNCTVADTPTPTVTSVTLSGTFDANSNSYKNQYLSIVGGTRKGQTALILASTTAGISGPTGTSVALTLNNGDFASAPVAGDPAVICGKRPS